MKPQPFVVDEYKTIDIPGLNPTPADLALANDAELKKRLTIRWLANGRLSVTAGPWVGIVELDCATIHVRPKLAGTELDVLAMYDYAHGPGAPPRLHNLRKLPGPGRNLRDLVCLLLIEESKELLRRGLRRDYIRREAAVPAMRGRLLADRQIMRRYGRLDQLECRFDELDANILDNRLCAAALHLAAHSAHDQTVREEARRIAGDFTDVCDPAGLDPRLASQLLTYHRGNERYRAAHRWALLLLGAGGFHDLYSTTSPLAKTFMFDMNALFQAFLSQLLRQATHDTAFIVRAAEPLTNIICHDDGRRPTTITPDIQLTRGEGRTAWRRSIDAKYKLYEKKTIKSQDLYQSFVYAHALSGSDTPETPTACIVFSSLNDETPRSTVLHRANGTVAARIVAIALNVPATLAALGTPAQKPMLDELLSKLTVRT
jgi:5-methylcytosine-specific restriction enzyme subunit McrC